MSKKVVIISIIVSVALVFYIKHHRNHMSSAEESVVVDTSTVQTARVPIEAHVIGTLSAMKNVEITPESPGHVAKIFFQDGGVFVKQGTKLVQLDDATYQAKLNSDKANLLYSQTDYDRKVLLGKQGAIAQQAIDQARADLETKKAAVEQSQVDVDKMLLVAPFDGVLGKFNISPGDYVTTGEKIVSLTDIQHLHVEYSVSEKYLPQLKLGQKISITTTSYPDKSFPGTVTFISPTINNDDRTIALYADVANDQNLLTSGMFVNVTQELGMAENVLVVPANSLVPTISGQQVFKIKDNKALPVDVKIGERLQNTVQITEGLLPGDVVVVAGQQKLREGTPVQLSHPNTKS